MSAAGSTPTPHSPVPGHQGETVELRPTIPSEVDTIAQVQPGQVDEVSGVLNAQLETNSGIPRPDSRAYGSGLVVVDGPEHVQVGDYEIKGELGKGGNGVVYRGFHPELEREVAVKVLRSGRRARGEELERFRREARSAARLRHPNIVTIHDVGVDEGLPYLVMDLIEGESLSERLKRDGPLEARAAAALIKKLAETLAFAHGELILHRDLKPANVLLTADGEPHVSDFGLAKDLRVDDGLTESGLVVGTPAYMPPEQAKGEFDRVDRRADVYSLGATLFEALAGQPPFTGGTALSAMSRVIEEEAQPPSKLRPGLDRDLDTIVLTCLRKEPERRYRSAQALADDLGRYLADEPIEARPPAPLERLGRWVRRHRGAARVAAAAAVLLVLLILGGLAWVISERAAMAEVLRHEQEREGRFAARSQEIEALLGRVGRGEDLGPDGLSGVVFRLVRDADERTVGLLAVHLEGLARARSAGSLPPGQRDQAQVLCRALGWSGLPEPSALAALEAYRRAEADGELARPAAEALERLRR